mmetsp:Transcript_83079/g.182523  ORF Transcript_83079/g.182523 Transcript_83079/m.182523 type:complete len:281 (+) Transcript_83079:699-1541(+)
MRLVSCTDAAKHCTRRMFLMRIRARTLQSAKALRSHQTSGAMASRPQPRSSKGGKNRTKTTMKRGNNNTVERRWYYVVLCTSRVWRVGASCRRKRCIWHPNQRRPHSRALPSTPMLPTLYFAAICRQLVGFASDVLWLNSNGPCPTQARAPPRDLAPLGSSSGPPSRASPNWSWFDDASTVLVGLSSRSKPLLPQVGMLLSLKRKKGGKRACSHPERSPKSIPVMWTCRLAIVLVLTRSSRRSITRARCIAWTTLSPKASRSQTAFRRILHRRRSILGKM